MPRLCARTVQLQAGLSPHCLPSNFGLAELGEPGIDGGVIVVGRGGRIPTAGLISAPIDRPPATARSEEIESTASPEVRPTASVAASIAGASAPAITAASGSGAAGWAAEASETEAARARP